jgi:hypothetical protein
MKIKYYSLLIIFFIIASLTVKAQSSCTVFVDPGWDSENYPGDLVWGETAFNSIATAVNNRGGDCGSDLVIVTSGNVDLTEVDTIPGDLIITEGVAEFSGTFTILGNLIINSSVTFTGTGTIRTDGDLSFGPEGGILTLGDVSIQVDGYFYDYDETHYIDASEGGSVTIQTHSTMFVPVGTTTGYYPVVVTAPTGQVFAIRTDKEPDLPGNAGLSTGWNVSQLPSFNYNGDESVTLSFIYPRSAVNANFDINDAIIMHFNEHTRQWEVLHATHTEIWSQDNDYYISTVEGISDFSPFGIGLTGIIPVLPLWTKISLVVIITLLGLFLLRKMKVF